MNRKIWIVISKIFALILIVYSIILIKELYNDVQMYYANPTAYNNGLVGVLLYNSMTMLVVLISFTGSVLYLFNKKIGWVLMCANLILFTLFITLTAYAVFTSGKTKVAGAIFSIVFGAVISLGLVGLFAKSTRQVYGITKNTILIGLVTALVLGLVYYFTSKIGPTVSFY